MQSPSKYRHNSSQTLKEQYSNTYGKTRNPLDVYLGQPRCSREGLGKAFAVYSHLSKHVRVHSGEKAYKCKSYGIAFSSSHLTEHIKTLEINSLIGRNGDTALGSSVTLGVHSNSQWKESLSV